jgi:hypothetical protein
MTPRDTGSIESIIRHMIDVVGAKELAGAVGKSVPLIYRWSEQSDPLPNIKQCQILDMAYSAKTGLPGPIAGWAR